MSLPHVGILLSIGSDRRPSGSGVTLINDYSNIRPFFKILNLSLPALILRHIQRLVIVSFGDVKSLGINNVVLSGAAKPLLEKHRIIRKIYSMRLNPLFLHQSGHFFAASSSMISSPPTFHQCGTGDFFGALYS